MNFKSTNAINQRMILKKIDKIIVDIDQLKTSGIKPVSSEVIKEPEKVETKVPIIKQEPLMDKKEPEFEKIILEEKKTPEFVNQEKVQTQKVSPLTTSASTSTTYKKQEPIKPKSKTDFEKFIGENLLNKIGILLLIVVLVLFGKYAVDKKWLNETAKVVSIILIGGVLIGIAHRIRINYKAFSSVLAGGGIAALYISIALGFQLYHLFSQPAAFFILIVITILAVLLSLAYDKKELAIIAIIGGFASPFLVSTGAGNYKILFTYILILDIGMLALAYFKKWNPVNFISNIATVILFAAWLGSEMVKDKIIPHQGAIFFATAFYMVFFFMNVINNIKENSKFTAFEFIMLIANTFLYYWAGMVIIKDLNADYMGLYTIILAVFNFAFALPLYRRQQIDKNLVFLLIGLVLTFASIAVPVQFKGNYITMFWAAEMALLLWLSQQSGIRLMKLASYIVTILMLISLAMDWNDIYFYTTLNASAMPVLINKGFITGFVVVVAILVNIFLLRKDTDYLYSKSLNSTLFSAFYVITFILTLYVVLLLEIGYQIDISYNDSNLSYVALACYNFMYLLAIIIWSSHKKIKYIIHGASVIAIFSLLIYIFIVAPHYKQTMSSFLMGESTRSFPLLHFLTGISVMVICFYLWRNVKEIYNANKFLRNFTTWFAIIMGLIVLTFELDYAILHINTPEYGNMQDLLRQNHLIGWPILWGIIAFSLMFTGIKINDRNLRIIGISIFFVTLIRFFFVVFRDMPAGGRIIAGASLAILLLVISFLYQKLKKIIFEDEQKAAELEKNEQE
jgi:uncharacterized membrane protein